MKALQPIKSKLKKGDEVIVIAGKDKGHVGRILHINTKKHRVFVENVNMQTKHKKPRQANESGQIIKEEGPVHYSNVLIYNPDTKKGERIRIEVAEDGTKKRMFAKSNKTIGN